MRQLKLSKRLGTAAQFVRDGAVVADVGTDHAYIPIYLVQSGKTARAIATDINEGPLARANDNIASYGLEDKIITYIANGLDGIEAYAPDDVIICGMGGELIADIIDKSNYVRSSDKNLILQPMTTALELREYLKNGFEITDEAVVYEDGKYYQIICACYDGQAHEYSKIELELGKINIKKREAVFLKMLDFCIAKKKKIRDGLLKGDCDTAEIEKEIEEMEKLI
ncbi:MAG: SAM-dependent methyltransferase [Clostridia bacterium]|nr:SAM-dependent methyltransferase [Clostridia bacterium]